MSKSTRKARLPSGEPSFFSRETAKKKSTQDVETETQEDQQAVERETSQQDLQKDVTDSISICHPILYGNYNLCDYASNKKLDKLSLSKVLFVGVLQAVSVENSPAIKATHTRLNVVKCLC